MPTQFFKYKGQDYILGAFGLSTPFTSEFYGHAWIADGKTRSPENAVASNAARSYSQVFEGLKSMIKAKADARQYSAGGERLTGTVHKAATTEPLYIGKLSFADQPPRTGRLIGYIEAETEAQAYEILDRKARLFAEKDGLSFEILQLESSHDKRR